MNIQARRVLDDCKDALQELTDDIVGSEWRRRWVACIALLRAVGHVLKEVDGSTSCKMRSIIEKEWKLYEKDTIFECFIKKERDNILKEYKFGAGQGVVIQIGAPTKSYNTYHMNTGHYKCSDPRDVVRQAIEWWEQQLDKIEKQVTSA